VIVAVTVMRMMQMAVDEVIYVVTVGHRFVAATWTVHMRTVMPGAVVVGRTISTVGRINL